MTDRRKRPTVASEQDLAKKLAATHQTMFFLARRLQGTAGERGLSSDALIASSILGIEPGYEPADLADFGRCCEAFAHAPSELRVKMLPKFTEWAQKRLASIEERAGDSQS